ncbi:Lin0512 family protein [Sedimentibacter sp.]|uniref:Lin0512 family protein n=1 Tax=Sedimentibacter sp. TaxID=1960295 RepID=UPI0028AC6401|nr:Lin0512 family protein [Sedimentibacter sp.]
MEFGIGIDFHGQDVTKASVKAAKDAVSKSCLIGLNEVCGFTQGNIDENVFIEATVAVSRPDEVIKEEVIKCFPVGQITVKCVYGGLKTDGLYFTKFGDKDGSIEVAVASVKVEIKNDGR